LSSGSAATLISIWQRWSLLRVSWRRNPRKDPETKTGDDDDYESGAERCGVSNADEPMQAYLRTWRE